MASLPEPAASSSTLVPPRTAKMATAYSKFKKWGKGVIGYPDDPVQTVSVGHWIRSLSQDPKRDVRLLNSYRKTALT